jgi:hypothetical protein
VPLMWMSLRRLRLLAVVAAVGALTACGSQSPQTTAGPEPTDAMLALPTESPTVPSASPSATPSRKPSPSPSRKPSPKPTKKLTTPMTAGADIPASKPSPAPTNDGIPLKGSRSFAIAPGGTEIIGTGSTLVPYQVEMENGITWTSRYPGFTVGDFASIADDVLRNPRGWTASNEHPVTDAAENMTDVSWSFQRVSNSPAGVLRIRLSTPDTTDYLCGTVGLHTQGVYSCRYGNYLIINLRRWLTAAPGFNMGLTDYRNMVINHEMGHRLGFGHMKCPQAGTPAPVMMQETISLGGCLPNAYPFGEDGTFYMSNPI